jgi:hypothetical protein
MEAADFGNHNPHHWGRTCCNRLLDQRSLSPEEANHTQLVCCQGSRCSITALATLIHILIIFMLLLLLLAASFNPAVGCWCLQQLED